MGYGCLKKTFSLYNTEFMSVNNLYLLDIFYFILHLLIISFNLFGWMWKRLLRIHLVFIALTALSWFGLGLWFGIGYCPVTDWHWQVKEQLGETGLPSSFITYLMELVLQTEINPAVADWVTVIGFVLAAVISIYRNIKLGPVHGRAGVKNSLSKR